VILYAATYVDPDTADADYRSLKTAQRDGGLVIEGAVVASRDQDGKVDVEESGTGLVGGGAVVGGGFGLIVGLFAPPLLLSAAIGAGIGAIAGELSKHHEEKMIGIDVSEYLPEGSSAILVVMEDTYLDGVAAALAKADKAVTKELDSDSYEKIKKALAQSGGAGEPAIEA
jgi:uncharacterized membrane protein